MGFKKGSEFFPVSGDGIDQQFPLGIGLGNGAVKGDFHEDLNAFPVCILPDPVVAEACPVDDDAVGNTHEPDSFHSQGEVVKAKGGGFCDQ